MFLWPEVPEEAPVGVQIARGQQAATLVGNEAFNWAWRSVAMELRQEWAQTTPQDAATRERLYCETQVMNRVLARLHEAVLAAEAHLQPQQDNEETRS